MKYPKLIEIPSSREMVEVFKGYNHNLRIGSGEFYDMKNLSSDNFPILSPRVKRGVYKAGVLPCAIIGKDALCYVDGGDFVVGGDRVSMGLSDTEKTLVSMGAYVVIMPDKMYINTVKGDNGYEYGDIEKTASFSNVTYAPCNVEGEAVSTGDATYIKISADGIGDAFSLYDGVTISGAEIPDLNASMAIWTKGEDYIVVMGVLSETKTQTTPITLERKMPDMDFIIESGNRLWGCKYGHNAKGDMVNEIYASKLGDFKNWNCFMGVSTDSYSVQLGSDGPFTGAVTHLGYPLFFKENCVHKVYGNFPANYQIQTTACRGVQKGSDKSLAIVNEVLFYKANSGICAYDGSLPVEMSAVLGDMTYSDAVGGVLGNKYYVSMKDVGGEYHLFVYDTMRGMWHREDSTQVEMFCNHKGNLYYVPHADDNGQTPIMRVRGTGNGDVLEGDPIKWEAVTGILGTDSPDKKYISRIDVRMQLSVGTRVIFFAEYDSSGSWEHLFTMTGRSLQSFAIPIRPQRCDHMRLKIEGAGDAKIFSICKTVEDGSDV